MSTATVTESITVLKDCVRMRLDGKGPKFGDFRDNLACDGFAVVGGAIPKERALKYANEINLGYDRNDPPPAHKDGLPLVNEKGIEPGVVEAFEKVYHDQDLIVLLTRLTSAFQTAPTSLQTTPGHTKTKTPKSPTPAASKGQIPRLCIYTCYMPVADASQEDLVRKEEAFENWLGATHWPNAKHTGSNVTMRDGKECPYNRFKPMTEPVLAERAFKLTGIPYLRSQA
ncbi:hypothetical protein BDW75DRAFT_240970 [Aspergillus navahoensis]